jgi:hypothetical protein
MTISPGDRVTCDGEGDEVFRVEGIAEDRAHLLKASGDPHGWEPLSKLKRAHPPLPAHPTLPVGCRLIGDSCVRVEAVTALHVCYETNRVWVVADGYPIGVRPDIARDESLSDLRRRITRALWGEL